MKKLIVLLALLTTVSSAQINEYKVDLYYSTDILLYRRGHHAHPRSHLRPRRTQSDVVCTHGKLYEYRLRGCKTPHQISQRNICRHP